MKVVGIGKLDDFAQRHADVKSRLAAWVSEAKEAQWKTPHDIEQSYSNVSFLAENIVVFNIKGNHYRLVIKISYNNQTVLIHRIGTHSEYSKWNLRGD